MGFWFDWVVEDWFVDYSFGDSWEGWAQSWSWYLVGHPWSWVLIVDFFVGWGYFLWRFGQFVKGDLFWFCGGGTCCSVNGILFSILFILCYALLLSLFCFRACVKSFRAFTIVSSGIKVGCAVCTYVWNAPYLIFFCFLFFWHRLHDIYNVLGMYVSAIHL